MKYSNLIGILALALLWGSCFFPWIHIPSLNVNVFGLDSGGTLFGKPGLMHFVLGVPALVFFIVPKIWAKRSNFFVTAVNMAWAFKNVILLSMCRQGECPQTRPALYVSLAAAVVVFIMSLLPRLKISAGPS